MTTITVPNHVASTIALLQGNADVVSAEQATLVDTLHTRVSPARIGFEFDDAWVIDATGKIHTGITVQRDGGFGADGWVPHAQGRMLIRCWASYFHTALELAQTVAAILMPTVPGIGGWQAAGTQVLGVLGVSEPLEYQDQQHEFRRAMQLIATVNYLRIVRAA